MILGRPSCGEWQTAIRHEWLATNGLGGYASGTIAGANTRRYHGFLMASLRPPVDRVLLVAKVDMTLEYRGIRQPLFANEFADGTLDPHGFVALESFTVCHGIPTWRYAIADALIEQQIFMAPGANTSYLRVEILRASAPLRVAVKPLVTQRDYHAHSRGTRPFHAAVKGLECSVDAGNGTPAFRLGASTGTCLPVGDWYWNFWHREEAARGLDATEDLWLPCEYRADLTLRHPWVFTATAEDREPDEADGVLAALTEGSQRLRSALPRTAPAWVQGLATASDQFIVRRGESRAAAVSIVAGYPWFADWGRDSLISLTGLTSALGRHDTARELLRTYAQFVDGGMLPNRFPESGDQVEYNTADATLWLFQALAEALAARDDIDLLRQLFPTLIDILQAHVQGTRFGIGVDPVDGLLRAGAAGTQLTWMDAKHGDQVFTPRWGKPVEINALWLNALETTARFAARLDAADAQRFCEFHLARAANAFQRFWNPDGDCLFDVVDVEGGRTHDPRIRPNQVFAVSLPYCVLPQDQMKAVVDCCGRHLLTSYGLRSLAPSDADYQPRYAGGPAQRDAAYHQGTVWAWLLGPFARAHYRVYGDAALAKGFLEPIAQHLADDCMGSVSEIFDGDAPHTARGCVAQAWSVAEILRAWLFLDAKISAS